MSIESLYSEGLPSWNPQVLANLHYLCCQLSRFIPKVCQVLKGFGKPSLFQVSIESLYSEGLPSFEKFWQTFTISGVNWVLKFRRSAKLKPKSCGTFTISGVNWVALFRRSAKLKPSSFGKPSLFMLSIESLYSEGLPSFERFWQTFTFSGVNWVPLFRRFAKFWKVLADLHFNRCQLSP